MKRNLIVFLSVVVAVSIGLNLLAKSNKVHETKVPKPPIIEETKPAPVVINPSLVPACACESSYEGKSTGVPQHYEQDGVTVRFGRQNNYDRGICQINTQVHGEELKRRKLDVEKREDNIIFANHLYDQSGLTPWAWSYDPIRKKCQWEE